MIISNAHENFNNNKAPNNNENITDTDESLSSFSSISQDSEEKNNDPSDSDPKPELSGLAWVRNKIWTFIQATINYLAACRRIGRDYFNYANARVMKLGQSLKDTWTFQRDHTNFGSMLTAILAKIAYTPIQILIEGSIIIIQDLIASAFLFIGGDWLTLLANPLNLIASAMGQSWKLLLEGSTKLKYYIATLCENLYKIVSVLAIDVLAAFFNSCIKIYHNLFTPIGIFIYNFLTNTCNAMVKAGLNLIYSIPDLFVSIAHLVISLIKAAGLILKGITIAAAALIIETKIVPETIKGFSRAIAIFNISLAAATGVLIDGLCASKNAFFNTIKRLFGYKITPTSDEEKINDGDDISDHNYYKNNASAGAQYFTTYLQNCGTNFLAFYEKERDSILPTKAENYFIIEDENNSQIDSDTKTQRRNSSSSIEI